MNFLKRLFVGKKKTPFCSVVVPAAGLSTRMGGQNKLFMQLNGIPVLIRTLLVLEKCDGINEIIVVSQSDNIEKIAELCEEYCITKATKIICGGATRTESVYAGTFEASKKADLIAVHDGARPLVTDKIIRDAIACAAEFNASAPAVPVKDTIKSAKDGIVSDTPDRSSLFSIQTPQVFNAALFKAAMENVHSKDMSLSDDCMAVEQLGVKVHLSNGSYENIKITTPEDFAIGEAILKARG